jgi:uncharacterized membrane protein HdeD (DUF308 family)
VQTVELLVIAASALGLAALFAVRQRHVRDSDTHWPRMLLGIVPGLIGVLLVMVPLSDFIPDEAEGSIWLVVAVAVSAVVVVVTVHRVVRG